MTKAEKLPRLSAFITWLADLFRGTPRLTLTHFERDSLEEIAEIAPIKNVIDHRQFPSAKPHPSVLIAGACGTFTLHGDEFDALLERGLLHPQGALTPAARKALREEG